MVRGCTRPLDFGGALIPTHTAARRPGYMVSKYDKPFSVDMLPQVGRRPVDIVLKLRDLNTKEYIPLRSYYLAARMHLLRVPIWRVSVPIKIQYISISYFLVVLILYLTLPFFKYFIKLSFSSNRY